MKILLLGKNGQIGQALEHALAPLAGPGELVALDRTNGGDLAQLDALAATVRQLRPQFIVNAAAYTAVDKAESEPEQARLIKSYGVKPEMECFDTGNLWFANQLVNEGLIEGTPMFQLCMGIPWGAPGDPRTAALMAAQVPANAVWAAFGIGRNQFPMVATAVTLGGHVRVGLEDNLYLGKGVYASNGTLTTRAVTIIEALGSKVASPDDARAILGLKKK